MVRRTGLDISLIETMPMGEIGENRIDQYLPLSIVRAGSTALVTGGIGAAAPTACPGPARYVRIAETGRRIGLITPLTEISATAATVCE